MYCLQNSERVLQLRDVTSLYKFIYRIYTGRDVYRGTKHKFFRAIKMKSDVKILRKREQVTNSVNTNASSSLFDFVVHGDMNFPYRANLQMI